MQRNTEKGMGRWGIAARNTWKKKYCESNIPTLSPLLLFPLSTLGASVSTCVNPSEINVVGSGLFISKVNVSCHWLLQKLSH